MRFIQWWRKPWDRCLFDNRIILSKAGYLWCRKHYEEENVRKTASEDIDYHL